MFRWLATCLLLCAGAVGLVILAARAASPRPQVDLTPDPPAATGDPKTDSGINKLIAVGSPSGMGSSTLLVIPGGRQGVVERREGPGERDGKLVVLGREFHK